MILLNVLHASALRFAPGAGALLRALFFVAMSATRHAIVIGLVRELAGGDPSRPNECSGSHPGEACSYWADLPLWSNHWSVVSAYSLPFISWRRGNVLRARDLGVGLPGQPWEQDVKP